MGFYVCIYACIRLDPGGYTDLNHALHVYYLSPGGEVRKVKTILGQHTEVAIPHLK